MDDSNDKRALSRGFWVGEWFVEPTQNRLFTDDETIQLEPKVMSVLQLMAEQPGRTVSKEAFKEQVWTGTVVTDDVLSRCISLLRGAFDDDARNPEYIETIRKVGYRLIAPVRSRSDKEPPPSARPGRNAETSSGLEPAPKGVPNGSPPPVSEPPRDSSHLNRSEDRESDPDQGIRSQKPSAAEPQGQERSHKQRAGEQDSGGQRSKVGRAWTQSDQQGALVSAGVLIALAVVVLILIGTWLLPAPDGAVEGGAPYEAVPMTSFAGQEREPALSPDGSQVAFTWGGEEGRYRNVYLMQQGAPEPLQLTDVEADEWSPVWAPTGQQLAFVRALDEGSGVFIVSSIGGEERLIARFPRRMVQSITWVRGSAQAGAVQAGMAQGGLVQTNTTQASQQNNLVLAVESNPGSAYALYRLSLDADTLVQLTDPPPSSMGDTKPRYAPSGDRVAFVRTLMGGMQDIYVLPVNGGRADSGRITRLTSDSTRITGLDWTPDGQHVVYASDRGGASAVWRVAADGGTPERVPVATGGVQVGTLSIAQQGGRLAFAQQSVQVDIRKLSDPLNYAAASDESFIASTRWDSDPDIASDGRHVAFVSNRSGHPEVWTTTAEGDEQVQLTALEYRDVKAPRWSPSGGQVAFAGRQGGHSDIYVTSANGQSVQRVTRHPGEDLFPEWSRAGDALYFTSNRSGQWEIWKVPAQGGSPVQVTYGGATAAQEHPDGSRLYVVRSDTTGLWTFPLADSLHSFVFSSSSYADSLRASQDGRAVSRDSLVQSSREPESPDQPDRSLEASAASGDSLAGKTVVTPQQIVADLAPYDRSNWHVRNRGIYFLRRHSGSDALAFYRFSTEQVRPVFLLRDVPEAPSLATAPAGDWFLYTRARLQASDILLVEGFE